MKSTIKPLLLIAVALLYVACSGDDKDIPGNDQQTAISFGGNISKEIEQPTRADGDSEGLEHYSSSFVVTGYKYNSIDGLQDVMTNYIVKYSGTSAHSTITNTDGWEYVGQGATADDVQDVKYWDFSAKYRFFGYVPVRDYDYKPQMTVVTAAGGEKSAELTMSLNYLTETGGKLYVGSSSATDFVEITEADVPFASNLWTDQAQKDVPVRLEFFRPYARICIQFMRAEDAPDAVVRDIKFGPADESDPIYQSGKMKFTYPLTVGTDGAFTGDMSYETTYGTSDEKLTDGTANRLVFDDLEKLDASNNPIGIMAESGKTYPASPQYWLLPAATGTPHGDFKMHIHVGTDASAGDQECVVPAVYMQWEPCYQYTYIFKITESGVNYISLVKVGMKTWGVGDSEERNFHNW